MVIMICRPSMSLLLSSDFIVKTCCRPFSLPNGRDPGEDLNQKVAVNECVSFESHKKEINLTNILETSQKASFLESAFNIWKIIKDTQWSESIELELNSLNFELNAYIVNQVLELLSDYELAIRFYLCAELQSGFKHDYLANQSIILLVLKEQKFDFLSQILKRMKDVGFSLHRDIYRILISGCVRANLIDFAIQTFDEMVESGCHVFSIDYDRFIGVLIRKCRFNLAEHYYCMMMSHGFSLDCFTYSRFISTLCKIRKLDTVQKLLEDMYRLNKIPDIWAYYIYVNLLCKEVLENMTSKGMNPDIVTYTTIVKGLCKVGDFQTLVSFWHEVMRKGFRPDNVACGTLTLGLCNHGKVDLAYELMMGMVNAQISLSSSTYNVLIGGYCRVGRVDKAQAIAYFMWRTGCKPDVITYNTLLNYCCMEVMLDEAWKLMEKMERSGIRPKKYS